MSGNSGSRSMITFRGGGGKSSPGQVTTLLAGGSGIFGGFSRTTNGWICLVVSGFCRMIKGGPEGANIFLS